MKTISLCMIVKNEEDVLARCLQSVQGLVDEIVIVDTGSNDRTKEIAAQFTDKIFDFTWIDDFAAARNFSFSKASGDYLLWLDADDVILKEDRERFLALKAELDGSQHMIMMKYNIAFDEGGNPTFSYYRERLMLRADQPRWMGAIHEVIPPIGNAIHSEIAITHKKLHPGDPHRNLRIFEKLIAKGERLDPRQQFYYARELYYHERYGDAIERFLEFLDGGQGWVENCIDACRLLALCYERTGRPREALASLLRSLEYGEPRGEICCELGRSFLERQRYKTAIFWYSLALARTPDERSGAFIQPDCYGYLPCLQLCVCYDRLGDHKKAREYNEQAAAYKPDSPAVLYNRRYFGSLPE